jgi:hypothetical protein
MHRQCTNDQVQQAKPKMTQQCTNDQVQQHGVQLQVQHHGYNMDIKLKHIR